MHSECIPRSLFILRSPSSAVALLRRMDRLPVLRFDMLRTGRNSLLWTAGCGGRAAGIFNYEWKIRFPWKRNFFTNYVFYILGTLFISLNWVIFHQSKERPLAFIFISLNWVIFHQSKGLSPSFHRKNWARLIQKIYPVKSLKGAAKLHFTGWMKWTSWLARSVPERWKQSAIRRLSLKYQSKIRPP